MPPQKQVPPERQAIYYVGVAVSVIGFLLFFSVFVSFAINFGDFDNFEQRARSSVMRGIFGIALILMGGVLAGIGKLGTAGSGLQLNPEKARRDVEPWSRMTGGILQDTLDEAGIKLGSSNADALPFDERLRRLQKLHDDGLISAEEFETTKKKILADA